MKREAFKMFLKPGKEKEYEKRHKEIWPELKAILKKGGIAKYSIFWDKETNVLYAYQWNSGDVSSQEMGNSIIVQRWWKHMADIMETNSDNSPISIPLEEVFYMD